MFTKPIGRLFVTLVAVGAELAQASSPLHCSCRALIFLAPGNALPRNVADNEKHYDRGEDDDHQVAIWIQHEACPRQALGEARACGAARC
jgi:hypothetical protein